MRLYGLFVSIYHDYVGAKLTQRLICQLSNENTKGKSKLNIQVTILFALNESNEVGQHRSIHQLKTPNLLRFFYQKFQR